MYESHAQLLAEAQPESSLSAQEMNDHFSDDKKKELIAAARQRVTELKEELKGRVEAERTPLDTVIQPLLDELLNPETQYVLSKIENIDDLTANLATGDTESLQRFLDALQLADSDPRLQSLRGKVAEALKFRESFEPAREEANQIKEDRIYELSEPMDTETLDEIDEDISRQIQKALLEDHQLTDKQLVEMIDEIISKKVKIDEEASEEPEKMQIEQLSTSLSELNYSEKMRKIEELREKLSGAETQSELEKYNIELNVQIQAVNDLFEPLLFQLRLIFDEENRSAEPLDEPHKTLFEQYLKLKKDALKIKNLPQDVRASYVTRKAVFNLIERSNSFDELQAALRGNDEIIRAMKLDFEMAGKSFQSDLIHEIKTIAEILADTGTTDEYDWSRIPTFLADKIKDLSPQFLEKRKIQQEERNEKKEKKALEFAAVMDSSANTLWLQKGLFKLGPLIPERSDYDCEELSIIVEAFWVKVSFSEPAEAVEKLIPPELNFPPLNTKLAELLQKHPVYVELIKIKAGHYNDNLDELVSALKRIGSKYFLSESKGITAGRMALILENLKSNWAVNVKVPRKVAGIGLGKRRLSKDEIADKLTDGSLSFLSEEKNDFILKAVVNALDKEGRA